MAMPTTEVNAQPGMALEQTKHMHLIKQILQHGVPTPEVLLNYYLSKLGYYHIGKDLENTWGF